MAYLTVDNSNHKIYLKPFHRFGRLPDAVDTLVDNRAISRIHAIIEWVDEHWMVRDISKNGVWLNDERLKPNSACILRAQDKICMAKKDDIHFIVQNLEKPRDILVPYDQHKEDNGATTEPILLEQYHFLPSESSVELIIFYDSDEKAWFYETPPQYTVTQISDGQLLEFSNSVWQLLQVADVFHEETIDIADQSENEITFIFYLSQDEESTELRVQHKTQLIDFEIRSHHYLTALLARYANQDHQKMIDTDFQGWVSIDKLTKDLGFTESHINIQIHRARKQFADKLQGLGLSAPMLIERKKGQVRFGSANFKIFKGPNLEVDTVTASK